MPPASFSDFPVEVLIQVYKSLDNVKDVTALNLASHQLHNVWLSNIVSISDAVLSRTIKGYDKASEFVELQQKFLERKHCDDDGRDRQTLERNKLVLSNARHCLYFYKAATDAWCSGRRLSCNETPWSQIYYCLRILDFTEEDTFAQSPCLASLDYETLEIMFSFINWYLADYFRSCQMNGSSNEVPLPLGTLVNFHHRLGKHIMALNEAEEGGNDVENA